MRKKIIKGEGGFNLKYRKYFDRKKRNFKNKLNSSSLELHGKQSEKERPHLPQMLNPSI